MSVLAMSISSFAKPDEQIILKYNTKEWDGTIDVSSYSFKLPIDLISYLKNKNEKVLCYRLNLAKTFSGNYVKPKELYQEDMDCDAYPNCIMVENNGVKKLLVIKSKLAKEFKAFASNSKNIYVPLFLYKGTTNINFINFK